MLPTQAKDLQAHDHAKPMLNDDPRRAPSPPVIAELWSMCDAICSELNLRLSRAAIERTVYIQQRANGRRYSAGDPIAERFITIVSLLPTLHGVVSCGAYIGTSASLVCTYVEPTVENGQSLWRIPESGAILDVDAIVDLFTLVLGPAEVRRSCADPRESNGETAPAVRGER